jgi:hypothetical protein
MVCRFATSRMMKETRVIAEKPTRISKLHKVQIQLWLQLVVVVVVVVVVNGLN